MDRGVSQRRAQSVPGRGSREQTRRGSSTFDDGEATAKSASSTITSQVDMLEKSLGLDAEQTTKVQPILLENI